MSLISLCRNTKKNINQTLFLGNDGFLNDYLASSFIRETRFKDYERVHLDCESDGLDNLIATMTGASLFAPKKLIIVKNPFFLTARVAKKFKKQIKQLTGILKHIDQLPDVIVLIASYNKLDRRKKISKIVLQNFNVIHTQLKSYEVGPFMKALVKAEGYRFDSGALQCLFNLSDQVLDTILSNYKKLKAITVGKRITIHDVKQNITATLAQNIFAIVEVALKSKYQEALARLDDQLREGSNPIQLLAVFENQLELLLVVKILAARGRSQVQIARELEVHPYRVKLALRNSLSIQKLQNLLEKAIQLDYGYKEGSLKNNAFLKLFVLEL